MNEHMLISPSRPYSSTTTYSPSPPLYQEVYSSQSETQTAPIEEFHTTDFPSYNTREYNPNPTNGESADPLYTQTSAPVENASTSVEESSHSTRPYSTREFIIPNTIYNGPADSLKDFVIFKPK